MMDIRTWPICGSNHTDHYSVLSDDKFSRFKMGRTQAEDFVVNTLGYLPENMQVTDS